MKSKPSESKKLTVLMLDQCRERGLPPPVWKSDEKLGVTVIFRTPEVTPEAAPEAAPEATPEAPPEVLRMVSAIQGEMTRAEIQKKLGLADEKHFREKYQQPGLKLGVIEMTVPDKPQSPLQKYRLTSAGKRLASRDPMVVIVARKAKATRHEPVTDKVGQA